ncbi:MAG: DUF420 domain-containing protein [Candidatus Omnitrophica bacterium]|nr:DUF420 domain-containing protein [Candidatus Omnitrophota bacterium]
MDITIFPMINAGLNATAGVFLFLGYKAIKANNQSLHKQFMIFALITSTLFLTSYLTYHYISPGPTRYQREGILRVIYFFILLTHTPLAAIIVPACCVAVYHAIKNDFKRHTQITRWLYPAWIYVSITGVIIYLMLYVF